MKTSVVVPDISHESGRPKSAWHCFVYDYPWAFAHLVSYLVEEELEECVMSRASTRLERMPFDSTDALLNYDQAHSVLISEALAVLEETADGISDGVVAWPQ